MADALDQLGALMTHDGPAPEPVARLQERIAHRRRRRRRRIMVASSFAAVAAALVLTALGDRGEDLRTVDRPPPAPPVSEEGKGLALPEGAVVSSEAGIEVAVGGQMSRLSDESTRLAFSVGGGAIVAQGVAQEAAIADVYPPHPGGPVVVLEDGAARELISEPGGEVQLHDAGLVNGRAAALVTVRTGSNPEDTDERMLLVDVQTGERTDLGSVGGWEAGLTHARLAGSRIVTVVSDVAQLHLIVRALDGTIAWEAPDVAIASVAVDDAEVLLLQPGFEGDDFEPQLVVDRYDLEAGSKISSDTIRLRPTDGAEITEGFCFYAELSPRGLICDRSGAGPISIDLDSGTTTLIALADRGRVTLPRPSSPDSPPLQAAPPAGEPCGGPDGTEPIVSRLALTKVPPGFEPDGVVNETSTGFVDMGGEAHATLRFSASDGRWIEFDSFGMESPVAYLRELHAGGVSEPVTYLRCVNPTDAEPSEYLATVSEHPDRTILAAQEWEYGGFSITGGPGVTVEELVTMASGLVYAPRVA